MTREDNVIIVHRPDGTSVVEHADGTRITVSSSSSSVTIECPGYSRVSYKQSRCTIQLPDSVEVSTEGSGEYCISRGSSGQRMSISSSGDVSYAVDGGSSETTPHYTLSHTGDHVLAATDSIGALYTVDWLGKIVVNSGNSSKEQLASKLPPVSTLPHFFLLNEDGSGYEIHHNDTVSQIMHSAEECPDTVCVRGTLPQNSDVHYSTIIKPCPGSKSSREKLSPAYAEETFIPANLRVSRTTRLPPSLSSGTNGRSRFGVGYGKTVNGVQPRQPQPKFVPPSCLQYRQFIHLPPLIGDTREALFSSIARYIDWREHQESNSDQLLPVDGRSTAERNTSRDLLEQVTGITELGSPQQLHAAYQEAWHMMHYPPRSPTPPRKSMMPEAIKQLQRDIEESKAVQETIRNGVFPPYFQSDKGMEYLRSYSPDMEALASKLPPHRPNKKSLVSFNLPSESPSLLDQSLSHSPQGEARLIPSGMSTPTTVGSVSIAVDTIDLPSGSEATSPLSCGGSLSKLRPSNPTPNHAEGDGSPTPLRPSNPTPQSAARVHESREGASPNITESENPLMVTMATNNESAAPSPYTPHTSPYAHTSASAPHSIVSRRPQEEPNTKVCLCMCVCVHLFISHCVRKIMMRQNQCYA